MSIFHILPRLCIAKIGYYLDPLTYSYWIRCNKYLWKTGKGISTIKMTDLWKQIDDNNLIIIRRGSIRHKIYHGIFRYDIKMVMNPSFKYHFGEICDYSLISYVYGNIYGKQIAWKGNKRIEYYQYGNIICGKYDIFDESLNKITIKGYLKNKSPSTTHTIYQTNNICVISEYKYGEKNGEESEYYYKNINRVYIRKLLKRRFYFHGKKNGYEMEYGEHNRLININEYLDDNILTRRSIKYDDKNNIIKDEYLVYNTDGKAFKNGNCYNKLCAIVMIRNNENTITDCLESVLSIADSIYIYDVESSDDSIILINMFIKKHEYDVDITFEKISFKDMNYSKIRNNANIRAKELYPFSDYLILLKGNYVINSNNFKNDYHLTSEVYNCQFSSGYSNYQFSILLSTKSLIKFDGHTHECLDCDYSQYEFLEQLKIEYKSCSPSYLEDNYTILENALLTDENKNNTRYMFYLGQTYYDLNQYDKAIFWYDKRSEDKHNKIFPEESWYSKYKIGMCYMTQQKIEDAEIWFMKAYNSRTYRAEPLFYLGRYHRIIFNYSKAYQHLKLALQCDPKNDKLFIESDIYSYKIIDELSVACFYLNYLEEGKGYCEKLLTLDNFPLNDKKDVKKILNVIFQKSIHLINLYNINNLEYSNCL